MYPTTAMKKIYKRDLAGRHFTHERPDTARQKLKFEIAIRPRLRQHLRKLQPDELSKFFSESEISAIKKYPGVSSFVPVIIILIGTCLTFYSGLSSESAEQQLPVCAFQTNPMACDRLPKCAKRIESRQTAELRFPNESFETPSPYFTPETNLFSDGWQNTICLTGCPPPLYSNAMDLQTYAWQNRWFQPRMRRDRKYSVLQMCPTRLLAQVNARAGVRWISKRGSNGLFDHACAKKEWNMIYSESIKLNTECSFMI